MGPCAGGLDVPGYPGLKVAVAPYEAATCSRCWRRFDELVADEELPDLCPRCHDVVGRLLAEGRAELREPAE
jgi:DNA-directed RNA polymerase subunit RPC12/RpoP